MRTKMMTVKEFINKKFDSLEFVRKCYWDYEPINVYLCGKNIHINRIDGSAEEGYTVSWTGEHCGKIFGQMDGIIQECMVKKWLGKNETLNEEELASSIVFSWS